FAAPLARRRTACRLAAESAAARRRLAHQAVRTAVLALLARQSAGRRVDAADAEVAQAAPGAVLRAAGRLTFADAAGRRGLAGRPWRAPVLARLAGAPARGPVGAAAAKISDAAAGTRKRAALGAAALARRAIAGEALRRAVLARLRRRSALVGIGPREAFP